MKKNPQENIDESINLIVLIQKVWEGKWKIVLITIISIMISYSYQNYFVKKVDNFTAITEIKPITTYEASKYYSYNNMPNSESKFVEFENKNIINDSALNQDNREFLKITRLELFNLYVEALDERSLFEDAIRKYNVLDSNKFKNEQEYNEAVIRLASSIKIFDTVKNENRNNENINEISNKIIKFTYNDVEKWKNVLIYVDELANKVVKKNLKEQFNSNFLSLKQLRDYEIEDLSITIDNLILDYDRKTFDRISYLKEQAAIAFKLGIANNKIEVQAFFSQNNPLIQIKSDSPFYLRGYEAINKEIELIETRTDKKPFINGLLKLEQKKRNLLQDKTLDRAKLIFQSTPIFNDEKFTAASTRVLSTKYIYKTNEPTYVLAILIGIILGLLYIYIFNAIKFQKHLKIN